MSGILLLSLKVETKEKHGNSSKLGVSQRFEACLTSQLAQNANFWGRGALWLLCQSWALGDGLTKSRGDRAGGAEEVRRQLSNQKGLWLRGLGVE